MKFPGCELLLVTFSLERKSNQKVQGKPDRSARFSVPRPAKANANIFFQW
jgi:hypothetical protein